MNFWHSSWNPHLEKSKVFFFAFSASLYPPCWVAPSWGRDYSLDCIILVGVIHTKKIVRPLHDFKLGFQPLRSSIITHNNLKKVDHGQIMQTVSVWMTLRTLQSPQAWIIIIFFNRNRIGEKKFVKKGLILCFLLPLLLHYQYLFSLVCRNRTVRDNGSHLINCSDLVQSWVNIKNDAKCGWVFLLPPSSQIRPEFWVLWDGQHKFEAHVGGTIKRPFFRYQWSKGRQQRTTNKLRIYE